MQDFVTVMGMIIKTEPIGEYDRRVVILTKERGKISAFAKGARRQNNRFMATMNPFCFGEFKLFAGRSSYSVSDAEIQFYFNDLRNDYKAAYYGIYFLEVADYYTRENNDERQMLKLLFQSLKALTVESLSHQFVRTVYEMKTLMVNGEFPPLPEQEVWLEGTEKAINFLQNTPSEKVYGFQVSEKVEEQLRIIAENSCKRIMDKKFNSLEMLTAIEDE